MIRILITSFLLLTVCDAYCQNPIFNGGSGDGWSGSFYQQPANKIYNGGNGDGWANKIFSEPANNIFNGGIGDGWSSDSTILLLDKIVENTFHASLSAHPNPTSGVLDIDLGKTCDNISAEIYNIDGQLLLSKEYESTRKFSLEIEGATGIYFVKLKSATENATLKIIKR